MSHYPFNDFARFASMRDISQEFQRSALRQAMEVACQIDPVTTPRSTTPDCILDALINIRQAAKKHGPLTATEEALIGTLERAMPPR